MTILSSNVIVFSQHTWDATLGDQLASISPPLEPILTAGGVVAALVKDGLPVAAMGWTPRGWDSQHFRTRVARVEFFNGSSNSLDTRLLLNTVLQRWQREFDFIHGALSLGEIASIRAWEDAGFRIADVLTTFRRRAEDPIALKSVPGLIIRRMSGENLDELIALGRRVFQRTPARFRAEPRFEPQQVDELYARWVENSAKGELADEVFVASINRRLAGFVTLARCDATIWTIPLIGVAPEEGGKGVARGLLAAAANWAHSKGADYVMIGTQANNFPMQALLPRAGFEIFKVQTSMHLWLDVVGQ